METIYSPRFNIDELLKGFMNNYANVIFEEMLEINPESNIKRKTEIIEETKENDDYDKLMGKMFKHRM